MATARVQVPVVATDSRTSIVPLMRIRSRSGRIVVVENPPGVARSPTWAFSACSARARTWLATRCSVRRAVSWRSLTSWSMRSVLLRSCCTGTLPHRLLFHDPALRRTCWGSRTRVTGFPRAATPSSRRATVTWSEHTGVERSAPVGSPSGASGRSMPRPRHPPSSHPRSSPTSMTNRSSLRSTTA
jgi:hypothetical protein